MSRLVTERSGRLVCGFKEWWAASGLGVESSAIVGADDRPEALTDDTVESIHQEFSELGARKSYHARNFDRPAERMGGLSTFDTLFQG